MRCTAGRTAGVTLLTATCLWALGTPVSAWTSEVHMAIAYIAYERLQPHVRAKVDRLIQLNPMTPRWTASLQKHVMKSQMNEALFMEAATWPDVIAHDNSYHDENGASGLTGKILSPGYDDKARHREWHVVAQPFSVDGSKLPTVSTPNALTEIAKMRQELV